MNTRNKLEKMREGLLLRRAQIKDDLDDLKFILVEENGSCEVELTYRELHENTNRTPQWLLLKEPFWVVSIGDPVAFTCRRSFLVQARSTEEAIRKAFNGPPPPAETPEVVLPEYLTDDILFLNGEEVTTYLLCS